MSFQNWNPDKYAQHRRPIRIKRHSTRVGCISPAQLAFYGLVLLAIVIYAMWGNSTTPDDKAVVVNTNGATSTRSTEGAYRYPSGTALNPGEVEWWIVKFTNAERASRGLKALIQDDDVATIAKAHSQNMTDRGLHHVIDGKNPTDRALAAGYDCRAYASPTSYTYGLSENISENPRGSVMARNDQREQDIMDARNIQQGCKVHGRIHRERVDEQPRSQKKHLGR